MVTEYPLSPECCDHKYVGFERCKGCGVRITMEWTCGECGTTWIDRSDDVCPGCGAEASGCKHIEVPDA